MAAFTISALQQDGRIDEEAVCHCTALLPGQSAAQLQQPRADPKGCHAETCCKIELLTFRAGELSDPGLSSSN